MEHKIPSLQIGPDKFNPQIPTQNPQGKGTIPTVSQSSFYNTKGEPINLPVIYARFYEALYLENIYDIVASVANPVNMKAGVAIYYIGQRAITRNYSQGTLLPEVATFREEYVPLDFSKEISYTYESLDLEQFGVQLQEEGITISSAFLSSINNRVAQAEILYNTIKLLNGIVKVAKDNIKITITEPGEWKEKTAGKKDWYWEPDVSIDSYRKIWNTLTTFFETSKSTVVDEYAGLDLNQFNFLAGAKAKVLLNMLPINYGGKSSEIIENMNVDQVSGIKFKTIPFLGVSNFETGKIDANESFDLTGVDAIFIHKEAYAFPIFYGQTGTTQDPTNLNLRIFRKWRLNQDGGKAIRPDLIWGIKIVRPEKPASIRF